MCCSSPHPSCVSFIYIYVTSPLLVSLCLVTLPFSWVILSLRASLPQHYFGLGGPPLFNLFHVHPPLSVQPHQIHLALDPLALRSTCLDLLLGVCSLVVPCLCGACATRELMCTLTHLSSSSLGQFGMVGHVTTFMAPVHQAILVQNQCAEEETPNLGFFLSSWFR